MRIVRHRLGHWSWDENTLFHSCENPNFVMLTAAKKPVNFRKICSANTYLTTSCKSRQQFFVLTLDTISIWIYLSKSLLKKKNSRKCKRFICSVLNFCDCFMKCKFVEKSNISLLKQMDFCVHLCIFSQEISKKRQIIIFFVRENAKTKYPFNPTSELKETGRCVAELGIDYSTMSVPLLIF
jgi:hypothetical protein